MLNNIFHVFGSTTSYPLLFMFQLVQIGHTFDYEWYRLSNAIDRVVWREDSPQKKMDGFKYHLETTTSKQGDLKLIAFKNENELFFERVKTKKADEEVFILMGSAKSLSSWMVDMEKRMKAA